MKILTALLFLFIFMLTHTHTYANPEEKRKIRSFSIHTGYANMPNKPGGYTKSARNYRDEMASGINWDAQFVYKSRSLFGIGFIYSGFHSSASHPEGSDNLFTHYIAPQLSLFLLTKERYYLRIGAGCGYQSYLNKSKVFGKNRRVTKDHFAGNIGLNFEYKIWRNIGLSIDGQYISARFWKFYSEYHDEIVKVKFTDKNKPVISRLTISAGVACYF